MDRCCVICLFIASIEIVEKPVFNIDEMTAIFCFSFLFTLSLELGSLLLLPSVHGSFFLQIN